MRKMLSEDIKRQLVERIKEIRPAKIILFGSHAYGNPDADSDVDLLVVTSDDFMPKDFKEKNAIYLDVSGTITDIVKKIPVDLIVHTKMMHKTYE